MNHPTSKPSTTFTVLKDPKSVPSGKSGLTASDANHATAARQIAATSLAAVGMDQAGLLIVIWVTSQLPLRNVAAQEAR